MKRFADKVNEELRAYGRGIAFTQDEIHWVIMGVKDTVFLLAVSINKKEYHDKISFDKFCKEIGIDWELAKQKATSK